MQTFWFAGSLTSVLVAVALFSLLGDDSWRWMLGSGAVLALIVMLLRLRIDESALWRRSRKGPRASAVALWKAPLRAPLALVALFWFLVTLRSAGFVIYTPVVLVELGVKSILAPLWMSALLFGTYTAVSLGSAAVIDRFDRRPLVLRGWTIATALTVLLALIDENNVAAVFGLIVLSSVPIQTVSVALFPWSVEFFPTSLRATAQSVCAARWQGGRTACNADLSFSLRHDGLATLGLDLGGGDARRGYCGAFDPATRDATTLPREKSKRS